MMELVDDIEISPDDPPPENEIPKTSDVEDMLEYELNFGDSDEEDLEGESPLPSELSWDEDGVMEEGGKSCPVCGKVLAASTSLEYHMKIHTGERPFPCQQCTRSFKVRAELNQHLRLDHGGQKPIVCNFCGMRFKRTDEMKRHQRVHTGEKPYRCTFCDKAFAHRSPWRQHEETHSQEKRYQCEDCGVHFEYSTAYAEHCRDGACKNDSFICCGEVFTKRMDYVTHKREKHNETKKSVSCQHCGKVFAFPYALKLHEQTHKTAGNKKDSSGVDSPKMLPLSCVTCDQGVFNSRSTLYLHRRSEHPDENPYQCKYCHRALATINALKNHERHHVSDAYVCDECGERFASRGKYFAHKRAHKSLHIHSCSYCGKRLANSVALASHERTHTGEKPFVCDICGKGFIQKQALTAHIRSHTKERPFSCSYCGQTFTYYSAMKCHERIHTGEKPYECKYCLQKFTRFGTYQNHVRLHTGEKPHECPICLKRFTQRSTQLSHMKTHEKKYGYDGYGNGRVTSTSKSKTGNIRRQMVQTEEPAVAGDEPTVFVAQQQQLDGADGQQVYAEEDVDGNVTKVVLTGNLENFDPSSLANVVFSGNIDAETIAKLILGGGCVEGTSEGGNVVFADDERGYVIHTEDGSVDGGGAAQAYFIDNPQLPQMTLEPNQTYELVDPEQFA